LIDKEVAAASSTGTVATVHAGLVRNQRAFAFGSYQATATVQLLPRCRDCGGKHPAAYNPPLACTTLCPQCGLATEQPSAVLVPSILADRRAAFGNWLMKIGAWLVNLSQRM
jgi:hypothetical protein